MSDDWRTEMPPQQVEKFDKIERGTKPFVVATHTDPDTGQLSELLWICDVSYLDQQSSAAIRVNLAHHSFYSDISDARDSRGYRRSSDAGGQPMLLKLAEICQQMLLALTF
jgi:hypothetical protein